MININNLPVRGTALDFVKIAAAILMLIDHIDYMVLERSSGFLYLLGRGAFPLFAYAAAASVVRARVENAPKYAWRLLLIAVLIVPIIQWSRDLNAANVIFTLAVGLGMTPFVMRQSKIGQHIIYVCGVASMFLPNLFEFGFIGALLVPLFYNYIKEGRAQIWLWMMLGLANFGGIMPLIENFEPFQIPIILVIALTTIFLPVAILALVVRLPNDKKRLMPKYFLHIFYPAHILALAVAANFI